MCIRDRLWSVPIGTGASGISSVGDRLYTMYARDGSEFLASFNTADGREAWQLRVDANRNDDMGDGPRSTPTLDGDMVYAMGASAMLVAAKAATGEKVWDCLLYTSDAA